MRTTSIFLSSLFLGALPSGHAIRADEPTYVVLNVSGGGSIKGVPLVRGARVSDTGHLVLPGGASLTIFGDRGKFVIRGAFEGSLAGIRLPSGESERPYGILTGLLMRALPFALRGAEDETSAGFWAPRLDTSGEKCIAAGQKPLFLVPRALIGRSVMIENADLDAFVQLNLASEKLPWPSQLPFKTGSTYRVHVDGISTSSTWRFADIENSDHSDAALLQALDERNCFEQVVAYAYALPPTVVLPGTP